MTIHVEKPYCFSNYVSHWEHLHISSCIAQRSSFLRLDNLFWTLAPLQKLCFSLGTVPQEQLHCSEKHFPPLGQFMLNACAAPAPLFLTRSTSRRAGALLKGASFCSLTSHFQHLHCSSNFVSQLEHLQMSGCIAQRSIFLCFDSSCWSVALLRQIRSSLGTPPNEQLHCSEEHLFVLWQFILNTCAAQANLFSRRKTSKWAVALLRGASFHALTTPLWTLVLLQQRCFPLGTIPNEQLHCSRDGFSTLWQFILSNGIALATMFLTWSTSTGAVALLKGAFFDCFDNSIWGLALLRQLYFPLWSTTKWAFALLHGAPVSALAAKLEHLHCSSKPVHELERLQSEPLHCSKGHLPSLGPLILSICAAPALLFLTWNTSEWAFALLKRKSFCALTNHFEFCIAPATMLLTWNTSA